MNDLVNLKLKGNIYLIGFMAAGKSKVGQLLAAKLEWNYIDTDTEIEKQAGLTITEIFEVKGESSFRNLESEVIDRVSKLDKHVISLGGGAIIDKTNWQKILNSGTTIRIQASPKVVSARTFGKKNRPLLNGLSEQQHLEKQ